MLEEIANTPVGDISLREPVRAKLDAALIDVVTAMRERRRGATIIEGDDGKIQGIFTERDLMLRVDHSNQSWHQTPVKDVMTQNPEPVAITESLATALRRMKAGPYRHLPVLNEDGSSIGVLSIRDIIGHIAERFPEEFINLPPDPEHEARQRWGG